MPETTWVTEGVDREATIKMALTNILTGADPHARGSSPNAAYYLLMYDNLFRVDRNGVVSGQLVTEWELTDGAWVFTLRDDAVFHDGSPVDAAAVKANLERVKTMETSAYAAQLASVESVDVVDDYTVRLNMAPDTGATLPWVLGGFAGTIINPAFFDPETLKSSAPHGVGSGPYELVEWTPGDAATAYERAGEHWDPAAGQAARLEIAATETIQAQNAVEAGQFDMATGSGNTAVEAVRHAEDNDDLQANQIDTYSSYGVWMQDRVDPAVREALGYAVDREALNAVFNGGNTMNNQLFPEGHRLYIEEIDEITNYDPEKAQEILADVPDDAKSFTLSFFPGTPYQEFAQLFQAQAAAVGITVELVPLQFGGLFEAWLGGTVDALTIISTGPSTAFGAITEILMRGSSIWAAPDSALADLGAQMTTADDPALSDDERDEIYKGILLDAAEEGWMLIFGQNTSAILATDQLVNVEEVPGQYQAFSNYRYIGKLAS